MNGRTNCGGSIKLHVVGGTTKPSSVAENTIWLNTSTTITNWCIQNSAPASPSDGDVYITTRTATSNTLDIGTVHPVSLYLGTARQRQSGAWVDVQGEVYYSSAWHKINTFVYDGDLGASTGNYNTTVGGKPWSTWKNSDASSQGTITDSSDHFSFAASGSSAAGPVRGCCTPNAVDLSSVTGIKFTYTKSGTSNSVKFTVGLNKNSGSLWDSPAASVTQNSNYSNKHTETINVSSLSGLYYIAFAISLTGTGNSSTINVYKIELIT